MYTENYYTCMYMRAFWLGEGQEMTKAKKKRSHGAKKRRGENRVAGFRGETVANNAAMRNARFVAHNYGRTTRTPMSGETGGDRENLDTAELLRERNVRDRGVPKRGL